MKFNYARQSSFRLHMNTIFAVTFLLSAVYSTIAFNAVVFAAEPTTAVQNEDNAILPQGSVPELIYTRKAKLNSGLTEGPAVAADGSIYFTDMPFGTDNGMILRFDPKTNQTTVFTENSGKSNGLAFLRDGSAVSCDGADGGGSGTGAEVGDGEWKRDPRGGGVVHDEKLEGVAGESPRGHWPGA